MTPEFTKPTTMTDVMELDCTTQVTTVPTMTARNRFPVAALIILRSPDPATACIPSDMCFMPIRNRPRPPTNSEAICQKAAPFKYHLRTWEGHLRRNHKDCVKKSDCTLLGQRF